MELLKSIFSGIFGGFCSLAPTSYEGHRKLWGQLYSDLTGGGYDSILPLVIQSGLIIVLIYFLRNDLLYMIKSSGHLFKSIAKKDIQRDNKEINFILMMVFALATFFLSPLFSFLFKGMSSNLLLIGIAFLISGIILYSSDNVKERKLSEKNETPIGALFTGIFRLLSLMPGFSGIGGMFYCGMLSGFTKEFSLKFSYLITLFATICTLIKNIIGLFSEIVITSSVMGYIFAFLFAVGTGYICIWSTYEAMRKKHLNYFGFL